VSEHILQFFEGEHLTHWKQEISNPFNELAYKIVANIPHNPERTVALRKLLESRDAALRACMAKEDG
jgi:hypothetical protein